MALVVGACGSDPSGPGRPTRSYLMGFSALPPRPDTALLLPTLTLATQHSDAALIQLSIPWQVMLDGISAATEIRAVRLPLANFYRGSGQPIAVALDVTDGLDRAQEAPELIAAGRSITEPAIQALYREYVNAVDTILHPEFLSLARRRPTSFGRRRPRQSTRPWWRWPAPLPATFGRAARRPGCSRACRSKSRGVACRVVGSSASARTGRTSLGWRRWGSRRTRTWVATPTRRRFRSTTTAGSSRKPRCRSSCWKAAGHRWRPAR